MKTLDEKVAEKMGWEKKEYRSDSFYEADYLYWEKPESLQGTETFTELPAFSSDWNDTKILIKFMRDQQAFIYLIGYRHKDYWHRLDRNQFFKWYCMNGWCSKGSAEITDDNLPLAACEAFMEVEL